MSLEGVALLGLAPIADYDSLCSCLKRASIGDGWNGLEDGLPKIFSSWNSGDGEFFRSFQNFSNTPLNLRVLKPQILHVSHPKFHPINWFCERFFYSHQRRHAFYLDKRG